MCALKYKLLWKEMIHILVRNLLMPYQIKVALAIMEFEKGNSSALFGIPDSIGEEPSDQIKWIIKLIKADEKRWQRYVKKEKYIDFEEFFFKHGGDFGHGWKEGKNYDKFKEKISEVENELQSSRIGVVGQRDRPEEVSRTKESENSLL